MTGDQKTAVDAPGTRPRIPHPAPAPSRLPVETPTIGRVTIVVVPDPTRPRRRVREWVSRNRVVVLFAVFLVMADVGLGWFAGVWEQHSPDDYAARVIGCAARQQDIVFLGGSPVAEGIDPARIVGIAWKGQPLVHGYSVGLSGGTTSDFYHGLLRACPSPPRVLVYGMTASDINDSRHEPHGPYSLMTAGDVARWVQLRPESAEWVIRHYAQSQLGKTSSVYRYRHGIRMWAATEANERLPGSCPDVAAEAAELHGTAEALRTGNGYVPAKGYSVGRYDLIKAAGLQPGPFGYLNKFRTGSHLKFLHRMLDWCETHGTAVVIVDMPVTADLEAKYAAEFAEYRARLAEVERTRRVTVIRATRESVGLDDSHYADLIHTNRDGARRFSDWLRRELERAGGLLPLPL